MVKKLLLKFIRRFYNPELKYIDKLIEEWLKNLVQFIVWIVFHGIMAYLALSGLIFVIPALSHYFFLGSSYWHIPIVVFYLGIMFWFIEELYKFFRKKKRSTILLEEIEKNTRSD